MREPMKGMLLGIWKREAVKNATYKVYLLLQISSSALNVLRRAFSHLRAFNTHISY